ncbi:MAG: YgjV family protein [Clostridia bacterium]|nr:YgjV family protein [Clostridia bacterium]
MKEIIGQVLGIAVTVGAVVSLQLKKKRQMLIMSAVVNVLSALNIFCLSDSYSGVIICLVAVLQIFFSLWHEKKNTEPKIPENIIFLILYIAGGAVGFGSPIDILSIIAAVLYMLAMIQKKEQRIRIFLLGNMASWTIYHAYFRNSAIFAQIAGIISSLIALFRYRKTKEK